MNRKAFYILSLLGILFFGVLAFWAGSDVPFQVKHDIGTFRDIHPAWSPDGSTLAFASDRTCGPLGAWDVYIMIPGETAENLTQNCDDTPATFQSNEHPQWSPDGTRLLYASITPAEFRPEAHQIIVYDLETNETRVVLSDIISDENEFTEYRHVTWLDNETLVYVSTNFDGNTTLYSHNFETEETRMLTILTIRGLDVNHINSDQILINGVRTVGDPYTPDDNILLIYSVSEDSIELVGGNENPLRLYDTAATWTRDGNILYQNIEDAQLHLWNVETGEDQVFNGFVDYPIELSAYGNNILYRNNYVLYNFDVDTQTSVLISTEHSQNR